MHELSIAQNILEIVHQSVPYDELKDVRLIRLKVGTLSGVASESLEFCFSATVAGTTLSEARLAIEPIPFRIRCERCGQVFENDIGFVVCPQCASIQTTIISGRELQISEIELDDHKGQYP